MRDATGRFPRRTGQRGCGAGTVGEAHGDGGVHGGRSGAGPRRPRGPGVRHRSRRRARGWRCGQARQPADVVLRARRRLRGDEPRAGLRRLGAAGAGGGGNRNRVVLGVGELGLLRHVVRGVRRGGCPRRAAPLEQRPDRGGPCRSREGPAGSAGRPAGRSTTARGTQPRGPGLPNLHCRRRKVTPVVSLTTQPSSTQSERHQRLPFLQRPRTREGIAGYMFLLPWLIGLAVLTIGPMVYSLYLSFTKYDLLSPPEWIGLGNYETMFTADPRYWKSVKVTLTYVVIFVPLLQILSMLLALLLNRNMKFLTGYRALFYLPSLMGASVAVAALWRQVWGADGLVNAALGFLGITGVGSWVGDPNRALGTIITLSLWAFGSTMIIFLAGLRQVPRELLEAAEVDGAGSVRRFFSVVLPLMTPLVFFN